MRLLITGGCGFLGSNIAAQAIEKGFTLAVFDNLSRIGATQNLEWLKDKGPFTFYYGDIRNREDVDSVVSKFKPDAVFHLAGQVAMTTSIDNPRIDFEINAFGTLHLLESIRKTSRNIPVIYSSTNKVYGDLEQLEYIEADTRYVSPEYPEGFPETIGLEFHSPYGCSKGTADQYMLDFHRIFGLQTVVFRHSSMFGGRQFATYDQGWVGWFCMQAVQKLKNPQVEPFTISGSGKQVRDILFSNDMVQLYFAALDQIDKVKGQAFNIGGGIKNSLSLLELFSILESELNVKLEYTRLPPRESDQKIFVADIRKINDCIGWSPETEKEEGIRQMIKWIESNE